MGVFANAIVHQIHEYEKLFKKKAKYLILSQEKLHLLEHECAENCNLMIESSYDGATRKQVKTFFGLEIVQPMILMKGSIDWALGE